MSIWTSFIYAVIVLMLYSCGGGESNTLKPSADSVLTITVPSAEDSLRNILKQWLADTVDFSKFSWKDKYDNDAILWHEDSIVRLIRLHRIPNDEGVEETTPDYLFFDESGTFSAFQVSYGLRYVTDDSVYVWKISEFYKEAIYGRGISLEKVDPVLHDYKFESLRFLAAYDRANINYQFSLHSFYSEFLCEAVQNVNAYTATDRSSEYFTLEPGQLPFHYIVDKKDDDGFPWIEIRIPTPDPVDNELLYIPADKFFASVSYEPCTFILLS